VTAEEITGPQGDLRRRVCEVCSGEWTFAEFDGYFDVVKRSNSRAG
jgi:hypothetical protein